jgi:hypothetical protein
VGTAPDKGCRRGRRINLKLKLYTNVCTKVIHYYITFSQKLYRFVILGVYRTFNEVR